ncbi:transcriptional repressor [bacterium]|nr:MAG: transcriptional repressor [bacterium]
MSVENAQKILKSHQLKATQGRLAVLELFMNSSKALSHSDIEHALTDQSIDRVTIYRILDCFVGNGIIHKVSSEQAIQFFALSHHSHHPGIQHAHFICDGCDAVECVDIPMKIEADSLANHPDYHIDSVTVTIHGKCSHCSN